MITTLEGARPDMVEMLEAVTFSCAANCDQATLEGDVILEY